MRTQSEIGNARPRTVLSVVSIAVSVGLCGTPCAHAQDGEIALAPTSLTPSCPQGENAASQSFQVWNSGSGTLNYTISDDVTWLACNPASGVSTGQQDSITVNYSTSSLGIGTHTATITVSSADAHNTPQTINVTLTVVTSFPALSVNPTSLTPSCMQGNDASAQTFIVSNSGSGAFNFTVVDDATWLYCSPTSGSNSGENDIINVTYNTHRMIAGTYNATITVTAAGAAGSPQTIDVTLTIDTPDGEISLSTASLTPSCMQGTDAPSETFEIWNSGTGTLHYEIDDAVYWLSCTPAMSTSTGEHDTITVSYNNTKTLLEGIHTTTITITSYDGIEPVKTIDVTLTIGPPEAEISLSTDVLESTCTQGTTAPGGSFEVWNSGLDVLNYTIVENVPWLVCSTTNGSSTGEHDSIGVGMVNTRFLVEGVYVGVIEIRSNGATNNPQVITFTLTVDPPVGELSVSTPTLSTSCALGTVPAPQSFEVWNSGAGVLTYDIADTVLWLSCSPSQSTSSGEHDTITVTYNAYAASLDIGVYTAIISVSSLAATNGAQTIEVTLTVGDAQALIALSTSSLSASCTQGTTPAQGSFEIWNDGPGTLNYTISDDVAWLGCTPATSSSTGEHDTINVIYYSTVATFSEGTYNATITVSSSGATNSPQTIDVTLVIDPPIGEISLDTTTLEPTCMEGTDTPSASFEIWNSGSGQLDYTIADDAVWLACSPGAGNSTGEHDTITVNFYSKTLPAGIHTATITISSYDAINAPQTIDVTLTVTPTTAEITTDPLMVVPAWTPGSNPAQDTFELWNSGTGQLNYTITDNAAWLWCTPSSGNSTGEHDTITINYNAASFPPGTYYGTITINGNATNAPYTIMVVLTTEDVFPPTVEITNPTTNPTCFVHDLNPLVDLAGTADDFGGTLASVTWSNDRGGSGACTGMLNWSVTGIQLQVGYNAITITAHDDSGNEGTDTLVIRYCNDFDPPTLSLQNVMLSGTALDDFTTPPFILVDGTEVPVSGGDWTTDDIPVSASGLTNINISASDSSGNSATVVVGVLPN